MGLTLVMAFSSPYKTKIASPQAQAKLKSALFALSNIQWTPKTEQYCAYRLDGTSPQGWIRVKQYTNGTFYLETESPGLMAVVAPVLGLKPDRATSTQGTETSIAEVTTTSMTHNINDPVQGLAFPYLGSDESGKGDYFGPLVVAGVFVTEAMGLDLKKIGVMDSKALTDERIEGMVSKTKDIVGETGFSVSRLMPVDYNQRYQALVNQQKNLNHLLASLHGEVLGTLHQNHPEAKHALVDQFGQPHYLQTALKGVSVQLHQTHRAERYIGVAAASILARYYFVQGLKELSQSIGTPLPLGAGNPVLQTGKKLVKIHGAAFLNQVAKTHFKTTQQLV